MTGSGDIAKVGIVLAGIYALVLFAPKLVKGATDAANKAREGLAGKDEEEEQGGNGTGTPAGTTGEGNNGEKILLYKDAERKYTAPETELPDTTYRPPLPSQTQPYNIPVPDSPAAAAQSEAAETRASTFVPNTNRQLYTYNYVPHTGRQATRSAQLQYNAAIGRETTTPFSSAFEHEAARSVASNGGRVPSFSEAIAYSKSNAPSAKATALANRIKQRNNERNARSTSDTRYRPDTLAVLNRLAAFKAGNYGAASR